MNEGERFVIERGFAAPRERVWAAWTTEEALRDWFGPKGVSITQSRMELRPGGSFHYCMVGSVGGPMWGKWTFREVTAPERLISTVAFSDESGAERRAPWEPRWPLQTASEIIFREDDGRTVVRIVWWPLDAPEEERRVFAAGLDGMRQGWTGTLDRLESYLAAGR